jgi:hypothetical protein
MVRVIVVPPWDLPVIGPGTPVFMGVLEIKILSSPSLSSCCRLTLSLFGNSALATHSTSAIPLLRHIVVIFSLDHIQITHVQLRRASVANSKTYIAR